MKNKYFFKTVFILILFTAFDAIAGSEKKGIIQNYPKSIYVQNEVIVGYKQGISKQEEEQLFQPIGDIISHKWRGRFLHIKIKNGSSVEKTIHDLKTNSAVEFAQPNYIHHLSACNLPNASSDAYFTGTTIVQGCATLSDPNWPFANINAQLAWDQLPSTWPCPFDSPVTVAILDSGCSSSYLNSNHPDLPSSVFAPGYNFVDNSTDTTDVDGHGTFVTGIIAAQWNNSSLLNVCTSNAPSTFNGGMAGMAGYPGLIRVMPIKIFSNVNGTEQTTTTQEIDGINFALDYGVKILNMSMGGTTIDFAEETAINDAIGQGCIIIASSGDSGNSSPVEYPAAYSGVIGVGATDIQNNLASYSNAGVGLWLVAPGGGSTTSGGSIFSTMLNCPSPSTDAALNFYPCDNNYGIGAGTSFSVPFVTGTIALMLAVNPSLTNSAITQILAQTSSNHGFWQTSTGYGLLNASAAVNAAINYVPPTSTPTPVNLTWTPTPTTGGQTYNGPTATPTPTFTFTPSFTPTVTPTFTATPTITVGYCVSWPGQQWTSVATSMPNVNTSSVYNCTVFDPGSGPKLWLVGAVTTTTTPEGVWSSPDGVKWTQVCTPTFLNNRSAENIAFNGKLLAIDGVYAPGPGAGPIGDIWSSPDGVSWIQAISQAAFGARYGFSMVVFQGKLWVIGGLASITGEMNDVWNSTDGVNFTPVTTVGPIFSPRDGHTSFVFNNQIWVVGGRNQQQNSSFNDVWVSSDGINWNEVTKNASFSSRYNQGNVVCGNAMWVVGGYRYDGSSLTDVWVSKDGLNWTQTNSTPPFISVISLFNFNNEVWELDELSTGSSSLWESPCCSVLPLTPTFTPTITMTPTNTPTPSLTPTITVGICPAGTPNIVWSTSASAGNGTGFVFAPSGEISQMWNITGNAGVNAVNSSVDGINWATNSNPSFLYNRCCEGGLSFNGNMWLLGGDGPVTINGTVTTQKLADVRYSPDGVNWNQATSNAGFGPLVNFGTAVFNGNMYVIGGQNNSGTTNAVCWSGDGNSWGSSVAPFFSRMNPAVVVFNGQLWVIGGMANNVNTVYNDIWASSNGTSWSPITPSGQCFSPRAGASLVVAGNVLWLFGGWGPNYSGLSDVWYTQDGIHWAPAGNSPGSNPVGSFFYADKIWTSGGNASVCYVATPTPTFTITPTYTTTATATLTSTYTPTLTWTITSTPTVNPTFGVSWAWATGNAAFAARWGQTSVVFDDGTGPKIYVMAGENSTTNFSDVWSSPDGINWTPLTSSAPFSGNNLCSAAYNGKIWVIGSNVYSSPDGIIWTNVASSPSTMGTAYQNVAVFNDGTGNKLWMSGAVSQIHNVYQAVWSSSDGANWNQAATISSLSQPPRRGYGWLAYGGKLWLIGGRNAGNAYVNDVWSSSDGVNWTRVTSGALFSGRTQFGAVVANGRMWVIGGNKGGTTPDLNDVWYSTDGVTWTQASGAAAFSARDSLSALAFSEKEWVIAGENVGRAPLSTPTPLNDTWYSPSLPSLGTATYTSTPTNTPTPGGGLRMPSQGQETENTMEKTGTPTFSPTFTPSSTATLARDIVLVVAAPNFSRDGQPVQFHITLGQGAKAQLTLFSISGERVYQTALSCQAGDNSISWDLRSGAGSPVASGLYLYVVEVENGSSQQRKAGKIVVIN